MYNEEGKKTDLLITFGCSWTLGIGCGYKPGMSQKEYHKVSHDPKYNDNHSFRSVLSKNLHLTNLNFSLPAASNQQQFRLAKEFFPTMRFDEYRRTYSKIIVLWGITSTARNEMYSNDSNQLLNFQYVKPLHTDRIIKAVGIHSYNHEHEVRTLNNEICFWNDYFANKGITNFWFDSFNHHEYDNYYHNLINFTGPKRDLLSQLSFLNNFHDIDNKYHQSKWEIDTNRIPPLIDAGILNPISNHPTVQGHLQIAELFKPYIEEVL